MTMQAYDASPATAAAATLLEVDLEKDGIGDAVEIVPGPARPGHVGQLRVSWSIVTDPRRHPSALTLALLARALLLGDPVDVSGLTYGDAEYAGVAAAAFARLATSP
jgi:hypothetical protein